MVVSSLRNGIVCLFVTSSLSYAATVQQGASSANYLKSDSYSNSTVSQGSDTKLSLNWQGTETKLPSIWDTWQYDWDMPQILSAQTENTYYGFGVWQPDSLEDKEGKFDVEDWILGHGVNFSFSAESKSTNTRYRFDMRWHEKTDTEILFQLQVPLR